MLKVLLVDDEEIIIEGLQVLINWEEQGFKIIGTGFDGEEGLELARKESPDIVITDIRMPVLTGLEMIDHVKAVLPMSKVIILSGYSDFDYARQALEKGASCYLLKPVSRDELIEKLNKVRTEIEEARQKLQRDRKLSINLHNMQNAAKEKYLKDIIDGKVKDNPEIERIWRLFEFGHCSDKRCVSLLEIDDFSVKGFEEPEDKRTLKFATDNIIEEVVNKTNAGVLFNYDDEKSVLINCTGKKRNPKVEILDLISEIKETVFEYLGVTLSIGIGSEYDGLYMLAVSFNEAKTALEKKFIYGKNAIIHIDDVRNEYGEIQFKPVPLERELISKVEACDKEASVKLLEKLFHYMIREGKNSPTQIYIECVNILALLRQSMSMSNAGIAEVLKEEYFTVQYLKGFKTYVELQEWMKGVIIQLIDSTIAQPVSQTDQLIHKIKKYLEDNYQEATREEVANRFYINPSYLSQIFKQATGYSFTDYLTFIRVEKAKKILVSSDIKIQDLAEKLGYTSSQYFSKVFEKNTGVSPFDYRKNMLAQTNKNQ